MTGLEHVRFADEELIKTQVLKGEAAQTIIRGENCSVYKMENETGEGVITRYPVFPGIELLYDDIHMSCGVAHREDPRADLLEIHHCRTGRFECEFSDGRAVYSGKFIPIVHEYVLLVRPTCWRSITAEPGALSVSFRMEGLSIWGKAIWQSMS